MAHIYAKKQMLDSQIKAHNIENKGVLLGLDLDFPAFFINK